MVAEVLAIFQTFSQKAHNDSPTSTTELLCMLSQWLVLAGFPRMVQETPALQCWFWMWTFFPLTTSKDIIGFFHKNCTHPSMHPWYHQEAPQISLSSLVNLPLATDEWYFRMCFFMLLFISCIFPQKRQPQGRSSRFRQNWFLRLWKGKPGQETHKST